MHHGKLSKDIAQGLKMLRRRIADAEIPSSKIDETMNIATWNVREFGKRRRLEASLHFIAEILGQFDLIAVVEVRDDVSQLAQVLRYLGPYWKVVFSDYIADPGGNKERIAFVYDERAVTFTGLASEADPPRKKVGGEYLSTITWWRPPYIASFRSGDFDFILLGVHVRWGESEEERVKELRLLAEWTDQRTREAFVEDKDVIVLGDFNIPEASGELFDAITSKGLRMPGELAGLHGTNLARDKRYDQILHFPSYTKNFTGRGGVLDFYRGNHQSLYPGNEMSKEDFTYQLSDHLPLWIQVNTDIDDERLDQILNQRK